MGQQGSLTYVWTERGTRPAAPRDQRYNWVYIFGAICPAHGTGAGLVLPRANTHAMNLHLGEIATQITPGAHAVLIVDGAAWHKPDGKLIVPDNITPAVPAARLARTEPDRERLAIPATELSQQSGVRQLPRDRRCVLRCLEPPHPTESRRWALPTTPERSVHESVGITQPRPRNPARFVALICSDNRLV